MISCLSFNPSGNRLAVGFEDGLIFVYDSTNPAEVCKICQSTSKGKRHNTAISQLVWNDEGNQLSTISSDNLLYYEIDFNQAKQ